MLAANEVPINEPAVASWVARGYTREQAIHQVALDQQRSGRSVTLSPTAAGNPVYPANHISPLAGPPPSGVS